MIRLHGDGLFVRLRGHHPGHELVVLAALRFC